MARDYKPSKRKAATKKTAPRKRVARKSGARKGSRKKKAGIKWQRIFWFLLIAAALITVVYFYIGSPKRDKADDTLLVPPEPVEVPVSIPEEPVLEPEAVVDTPEEEEFTYDFYTRLPEAEVVISDEQYRKELKNVPEVQQESAVANSNDRYMIQVGAFRRFKEADSLKAELAILGFQATIQKVKATDGQFWNRVRLGPYTTLQEVNKARTRLHSQQMKTQLVKLSD